MDACRTFNYDLDFCLTSQDLAFDASKKRTSSFFEFLSPTLSAIAPDLVSSMSCAPQRCLTVRTTWQGLDREEQKRPVLQALHPTLGFSEFCFMIRNNNSDSKLHGKLPNL